MELNGYKCECQDAMEFMEGIADSSIKLIITSPPYNVGKEYEIKVNIEKYLENMKLLPSEMYRILSFDGSICWQVGNFVNNGEVRYALL